MEIETVEDLSNKIADWISCYGACKSTDPDGCEHSEKAIACCRVGFMNHMKDRIREAVKNDELLTQLENKQP